MKLINPLTNKIIELQPENESIDYYLKTEGAIEADDCIYIYIQEFDVVAYINIFPGNILVELRDWKKNEFIFSDYKRLENNHQFTLNCLIDSVVRKLKLNSFL